MQQIFIILLIALSICPLEGQVLHEKLAEKYDDYKEPIITNRRFKHKDIQDIINQLPSSFIIETLGRSVEGRSIRMVSVGQGPVHVLLWSQMHGNEPTATMAIMDIFRFLQADDQFNELRQELESSLTLHFIPMLNPDGADRFERRNALDIDLNRDALRLQSPEAQILKNIRDRIDPTWGFNLHDQNRYSTAGPEEYTASISFLAPAYNEAKDWNEGRTNAMQLIVAMHHVIDEYVENKIGRYSDTFEPRAFGDNIQKWGTNTILIETGGLIGDPEKQFLRKVNFIALVSAFKSIIDGSYEKHTLKEYNSIPFNRSYYHDLILRELQVKKYGQYYTYDLGFRKSEYNAEMGEGFYERAYIADMGDLHNYYGYEDHSLAEHFLKPGKAYGTTLDSIQQIEKGELLELLKKGYIYFFCKDAWEYQWLDLPIQLLEPGQKVGGEVYLGSNPSGLIGTSEQISHILLNGHLYHLKDDWTSIVEIIDTFYQ